jgi:hypothetical protein
MRFVHRISEGRGAIVRTRAARCRGSADLLRSRIDRAAKANNQRKSKNRSSQSAAKRGHGKPFQMDSRLRSSSFARLFLIVVV